MFLLKPGRGRYMMDASGRACLCNGEVVHAIS
jgi:hypothetical protein